MRRPSRCLGILRISCIFFLFSAVNFADSASLDLCHAEVLESDFSNVYKYKDYFPKICGRCGRKCFRKCCAHGFYMDKSLCIRNRRKEYFNISIFNREFFVEEYSGSSWIVGTMTSCDFFPLKPSVDPTDRFFVQKNGVLWVPEYKRAYGKNQYCIDSLEDGSEVALVCFPERIPSVSMKNLGIYIGMIISMPFLLVTFLVYAFLPDRNLHMKALMCYVLNLFFAYIFLVTIQLTDEVFEDTVCAILGFCCVFFFLASFFWMNVICIDIFLGFRGFRGVPGVRSSERKRFILYCIYAWGMSLLIVFITFMVNHFGNVGQWFYPGVAVGQCFIRNGLPQLLYFYGPMGLIIILNVVLFTMTALRIRRVKKDTAMLKHSESKRHSDDEQQNFNLYLKLLLAMGVNWTMELISWAVNLSDKSVPQYVWYLSDFCNATYGVFIFFIFVFKRNIWKQLKRRYYSFMGRHHLAHSMGTTNFTKTTNDSMTVSTNDRALEESELNSSRIN